MRVAVTGAAGFVGGAVVTRLREHGHDVVPLTRREWDISTGPRETAADAVVHCAALADDSAPLGDAMLANRIGTRNVVASFPGARIVHISTSSVYDAFTPSVDVQESAGPVHRFLSAYSESKTLAEAELQGVDAVILRPHAVYGPGDTTLLPRLLAGVRRGRLVLPAGAEVLHSLTHVDNLVAAVRLGLTGPSGTYNIADDAPVLLSDVLREVVTRRGMTVELAGIPYRVASALAATLEATATLTRTRPRLTRYAVSQLGLERTLDLTAARERLGYRPKPTTVVGAEEW